MQSAKFCPKCGKQNTIILSDVLGIPFTLENKPSIPRGDSLHAAIHLEETGPLFSPGICDECGARFAIFGIPPEDYVPSENKV
jgi:hypothetical protein